MQYSVQKKETQPVVSGRLFEKYRHEYVAFEELEETKQEKNSIPYEDL